MDSFIQETNNIIFNSNFKNTYEIITNNIIKQYDDQTIYCIKDISEPIRNKLIYDIFINLESKWKIFIDENNNIFYKTLIEEINDYIENFIEKNISKYINDNLNVWTFINNYFIEKYNDYINNIAEYNIILCNHKTQYNDIIIKEKINEIINNTKIKLLDIIITYVETTLDSTNIQIILKNIDLDIWNKLNGECNIMYRRIINNLSTIYLSMDLDDITIKKYNNIIYTNCNIFIKKIIQDYITHLDYYMEKKFDELFKFENGIPKIWDIKDIQFDITYGNTKKYINKLINNLVVYKLDNTILMDKKTVDIIIKIMDKYTESVYKQIKFEQDYMFNKYSIPSVIWLIFLLLGSNEIIWGLKNPFISAFLLIIFGSIYTIAQVNGGVIYMSDIYINKMIKYIGNITKNITTN